MSICAPCVSFVDSFINDRVIALDFIRQRTKLLFIINIIAPNVYEVGSLSIMGMFSRCSCLPWISLADLFSDDRVVALYLVKLHQKS